MASFQYASRNKQLFRKVGLFLSLMLFAVSVLVLVQWQQHGLMALSVQSGSMSPLIAKGDAVVIRKVEPTRIQTGDVVSYPDPDHPATMLTHRVVDIDHYSGRMVTKGDANVTADQVSNVLAVAGVVHYKAAKAGYLIDFLRSWTGLVLCVYLPAALLVGFEVRRLLYSYLTPTYQLRR